VTDATGRLATLELRCTTEDALAFFDTLPSVAADAIRGRWVGRELRTGHPWDGLLTASGWYGKQFDNAEAVHPLLFRTPSGRIFPVDPGRLPLSLAHRAPVTAVSAARRCLDLAMPLLRARAPKARLRNVEHRNTITAAMIYDQLSIIDVFRRVDDVTLLGLMDMRGVPLPYFFVLVRSGPPRPAPGR